MPRVPDADPTLELAMELIARRSVTPADAGCQELIAKRLARVGFTIERLRYGEVDNLWAHRGSGAPLVVFLGHTDVVPPGPQPAWHSDPFVPVVRDGMLYGRGAADMKSSVAAFVVACEQFVADRREHPGTLAVLLTSDEEGPAVNGTVRVIEQLGSRGMRIDYCMVGEPTASATLGDVIKHGRRGSLTGKLHVRGIQGHVAYPHLARNPVHLLAPALAELVASRWDEGDDDFPPTSMQISNVHAGTGADNVIPGELDLVFNFRFSPAVTAQELRDRVAAILGRHGLDYELDWSLSGGPFITRKRGLIDAVRASIREVQGLDARLSTDGGTSDGRFVAPTGAEVVECGPLNATIHKVNECIPVADLPRLTRIYRRVIDRLFA